MPRRKESASPGESPTEADETLRFRFENYVLDVPGGLLTRDGKRVRIQRKPFEVLRYLISNAPRLVTREELLQRFWSRAVNEEALTRCVSTIRKLLRDTGDPPRFIETQRGRGYRFIANIATQPGDLAEDDVDPPSRGPLSRKLLTGFVIAGAAALGVLFLQPERTAPDEAGGGIERIAVLPIAVNSVDDAWLAPVLTDHLMQTIARIEGVSVVTFSGPGYPSEADDPASIGVKVRADGVLISTLEPLDAGSRLSARLIDVENSELLWTLSVDSEERLTSSEQVESLALRVATRLRPMLQLRAEPAAVHPDAYRAYLRGRYYWGQRSLIGLQAAIESFETALALEPDYADALVGAAESWLLLPLYGAMPPAAAIPKARDLAMRALASRDHDARALAVLGTIAMQFDWDWTAAEALLGDAVTLNPNDATAQQWLGELYCYRSQFDLCRRQFRIALDLDPLSPVLNVLQGSPALFEGDYRTALELYSDSFEQAPNFPLTQYVLGLASAGLEDWPAAIRYYRAAMPNLGLSIVGGPLVFALARSGNVEAGRELLDDLEALATERYVPPTKLAVAYLGLDQAERALEQLRKAVEVRDDRLVYLAVDVHFRDVVEAPGFEAIANRVGPGSAR